MANNDIRDIVMEIQRNQVEMMNLLYELKNEVSSISKGGDNGHFPKSSINSEPVFVAKNSKASISSEPMVLSKTSLRKASIIFSKRPKQIEPRFFNKFDSTDTDLLETFSASSSDEESIDQRPIDDVVSVFIFQYYIYIFLRRYACSISADPCNHQWN